MGRVSGQIIRRNVYGTVTGNKGDIYAEGTIMKHVPTGKWIIGRSKRDMHAKEIGGCGDGPSVIDFKKKFFLSC